MLPNHVCSMLYYSHDQLPLVHRYYAMPKCLSSNQLEACPEILHQGLVESIPCHFQSLSVCCMGPRKVHTYVGLEWDSFLEDME